MQQLYRSKKEYSSGDWVVIEIHWGFFSDDKDYYLYWGGQLQRKRFHIKWVHKVGESYLDVHESHREDTVKTLSQDMMFVLGEINEVKFMDDPEIFLRDVAKYRFYDRNDLDNLKRDFTGK